MAKHGNMHIQLIRGIMRRITLLLFLLLIISPAMGIIDELDSESFDNLDISTIKVVLTHTPDAGDPMLCQAYITLGSAGDPLTAAGGFFEFVMTVGGQTVQPSPEIVNFGTQARASVWTGVFPVPENQQVVISVTSPNADTADITAYLYDVSPGPVSLTAAQFWSYGTRILTALDEDSTTIDIDGSAIGSVTAAVTTDAASRTASKANVSALATSSALSTHDGKLDTVDNFLDTEVADIIDMLKAVLSKAYTLLTAVGTYDPSTDSLEAQQENPQGPPIID